MLGFAVLSFRVSGFRVAVLSVWGSGFRTDSDYIVLHHVNAYDLALVQGYTVMS